MLSSFVHQFSPRTNWCQTSRAITSFPFVTSHSSHLEKDWDPTAPEHLPRTGTNPLHTTTVIDIRVVSCNPPPLSSPLLPCSAIYRQKQQKTFTTQTTRSPCGPDMATCISRCLSKSGIIEQGSIPAFPPYFREVFCSRFCFSENCPQWVVGSSGGPFGSSFLLGDAAWPSSGGVAFSLSCWVGLLFTSLLWVVVLSLPAPSGPVFFFFWEPAPKEEEGSTTKRMRRPSTPPAREGRESRTTEREEEGPPRN